MNGGERARQPGGGAQLAKSQVRLLVQQTTETLAVPVKNLGLAPGKMVAWGNVTGVSALLKKFLDHP